MSYFFPHHDPCIIAWEMKYQRNAPIALKLEKKSFIQICVKS